MNCPYCNFHFDKFIVNSSIDHIPDDAPILCQECLNIGLFENGKPRKVSQLELESIKLSPAYTQVLGPLTAQIKERNRRLIMHQNG